MSNNLRLAAAPAGMGVPWGLIASKARKSAPGHSHPGEHGRVGALWLKCKRHLIQRQPSARGSLERLRTKSVGRSKRVRVGADLRAFDAMRPPPLPASTPPQKEANSYPQFSPEITLRRCSPQSPSAPTPRHHSPGHPPTARHPLWPPSSRMAPASSGNPSGTRRP